MKMLVRKTCQWAILALCLASNAAAEEKIKFDPTRDLPGFEDSRSSENKDLFPLDPYVDMLGREMGAKELADVQARWRAEFAEIHKHLDEVRTDPIAGTRWVLAQRMAKHPFFSKVTLTLDTSVPPFMIYVQKPSFDDPNYATSIVQLFTPYLTKLVGVVDEHVAKPSGAQRKVNRPLTPIVVLASPGDLENYYRLGGPDESFTRGADYNPKLDLVVFAVNSFEKPKATASVLHSLLRESFLSMMAAHAAAPQKNVPSMWLREGMASAFTWPRGGKVEALDKPEIRTEDVKLLVELCHQPPARTTYLQPIAALSSVSTWEGLTTRAFGQTSPPNAAYAKLSTAFLAQSSLWMHFLTYGKEGRYRPRFDAYVKTAMVGQSGADALSLAFAGTKLADLDREFFAWVFDEHQRLLPNVAIDRTDLVGLFDPLPKAGVNDEIVARAKQSLPPEAQEAPFEPATLAIGESDVESRHGLALNRARSGDFEAARTMLQSLAEIKPASPEDGRIARDIQRLSAAITLREGLLAGLIAKNARLAIEVNGKKVNAPVAKVENGQIVFGENSFGAKSLPLIALDPLEIARQADKKELQGNAPPWTRPWLYLLCGDARWEKLLKTDSTEAREVKEDGAVWYRDRLKSGIAAASVEKLSKLPVPTSRAEAEAIIETIRELMKSHAQAASVLMKKDALGNCARSALTVAGSEGNGSELVRGQFTTAADGVVTLVYDFKAPDELLDFHLQKGHLLEWRTLFSSGELSEDAAKAEVKDGELLLSGNGLWRIPIGFLAPLKIRAEFSLHVEEGKLQNPPNLGLVFCDSGSSSYAYADSWGIVQVVDAKGNARSGTMQGSFTPGQEYVLEVDHDGKHASSLVDGTPIGKTEVGGVQGGAVEVLAIALAPARVDRLEIVGKVDPASLVAARAAWVSRTLLEMGF